VVSCESCGCVWELPSRCGISSSRFMDKTVLIGTLELS
jgi:hypothetical protein